MNAKLDLIHAFYLGVGRSSRSQHALLTYPSTSLPVSGACLEDIPMYSPLMRQQLITTVESLRSAIPATTNQAIMPPSSSIMLRSMTAQVRNPAKGLIANGAGVPGNGSARSILRCSRRPGLHSVVEILGSQSIAGSGSLRTEQHRSCAC